MSNSNQWGKYESYEAYINRGLDGVFNSGKNKHTTIQPNTKPEANKDQSKSTSRPRRRKPKDVYDIVSNYDHHEGDKAWLVDMLLRLPLAKREPVMFRYSQLYNSALRAAPDTGTESGQARTAANTWLRESIELNQ